jgi:hypothetical protein
MISSTPTLHLPRRSHLRWPMGAALVAAALASSRIALADVSVVMDPSPPFSGTLVAGDFAESTRGIDETYTFNGEASNATANAMRLVVTARANGAVVSGSDQTLSLAPNATTSFNYTFADPGASPSTVGLDFDAPDGTVSFVAGTFHAQPVAAAPATGSRSLAVLATLLLLCGVASIRARSA